MLFNGKNEITMDAKGRVAVPARYRDLLMATCSGNLVATIDIQDPCLRVYPLPVWQEFEARLESLPANPGVRRVQRLMLGYASELQLDGSGRVLLPPSLRKYANLEKNLVLVGQGKKLELWSEDNWQAFEQEAINGIAELPAEIASLSF